MTNMTDSQLVDRSNGVNAEWIEEHMMHPTISDAVIKTHAALKGISLDAAIRQLDPYRGA